MFEVKEKEGMKGLYALKFFEKGQVVCKIEGEVIDAPTRTSVQLRNNQHIDVKSPIMYINHNCRSNISLNLDRFEASRDIAVGEEIVFNYLETEDELSDPFVCRNCGNLIKGRLHVEEFPCGKEKELRGEAETLTRELS